LTGEWYEIWNSDDHVRLSQFSIETAYYHRFGDFGLTVCSSNEYLFSYDGWINLSFRGFSSEFALESYYYPAILQSRFNGDFEADFMAFRFSYERVFNEYFSVSVNHGWSKRLNETYSLYYSPNLSRITETREREALMMKGNGYLKFGNRSIALDLNWNYRDYNGFEFLWYHPGKVNIQPGLQAGSVFFQNLNIFFRMEGLWQYHDSVESVWFYPALPVFVPIRPSRDLKTGDWTMNGEIQARVKSLTLRARIENVFQKDVFIANNIMPNSRMFIFEIQWIWHQ
jgi:hypothetical protein